MPIARGCIYNCSFCCGAKQNSKLLFGRDNIIYRSPIVVANDIYKVYLKNVQTIYPTHDLQMFGAKYYREIFKLLKYNNVKIGIYNEAFSLPSIEFISEVKETFSVITIAISALSGDEDARYDNGKLFSNDELFQILNVLANKSIKVELYYNNNLANEIESHFDKTLSQIEKITDVYPSDLIDVRCISVLIDPLAPMRKQYSIIKSYLNTFEDYYNLFKNIDKNENCMDRYIGYEDNMTRYLGEKVDRFKRFKSLLIKKNLKRLLK